MNREFFFNIFVLLFLNLVVKSIYIFGIDRVVQNIVPSGDYGVYFTLLSFSFIFQIISDLGVRYFNNRHLAQHRFLLDKYFPGLLMLKGLLALAYLLIIWGLGYITGYSNKYPGMMWGVAIIQLLSSFISFLRSNISGMGLYFSDSIISVVDRFLLIAICGCFLYIPALRTHFSIKVFIGLQVFSLGVTSLIAFMVIRRLLERPNYKFNWPFTLLLLKKSTPYALAVFLMTIYSRIDTVMMEQMLADGIQEADYYASAFRLFEAANIIGYLFSGLLLPMFARQIKQVIAINNLMQISLKMILAGAIPLSIISWFFRSEIMIWLYNSGSLYTGNLFGVLMLGFIAVCGGYIFSALLTANDNLKEMNRVFILGVVVNIVLNFILIPHYKAFGAAIATCVTQYIILLAMITLSMKLVNVRSNPRLMLKIGAVILLIGVSTYWIKEVNFGVWQISFTIASFTSIIFVFLFGLLNLKSFKELIISGRKPE